MRRVVLMVFGIMISITAIGLGLTGYRVGFLEGEQQAEGVTMIKEPAEYGVHKMFYTWRRANETEPWSTPEQLGIALIRDTSTRNPEFYWIYIVDGWEDRALPWMRVPTAGENYVLPVVKYEGKFYHLGVWFLSPHHPKTAQSIMVEALLPLAVGWGIFAVMVFVLHKRQAPANQKPKATSPYMSNLRITILCIYNISLGLLSLDVLLTILQFNYALSWGSTVSLYMFTLLYFQLTLERLLLLSVMFSGIFSASIQLITSITLRKLHGDIGTERTIFYVLGPFIGMGIALVVYFLMASYYYIDINPYHRGIDYNTYLAAAITSIVVISALTMLEKLKARRFTRALSLFSK